MNMKIIRIALAMMLCTVAVKGQTQDDNVIFNDDFNSGLEVGVYVNSDSNPRTNWYSFKNCKGTNITTGNKALSIERDNVSGDGHATTVPLNHTGNLILIFSHAYTSKNNPTKAKVILTGGATFQENNSNIIEIDVEKHIGSGLVTTTLHILNAVPETTVSFESTSSKNYAIDDILILTDGLTFSEAKDNTSTISLYKTITATVNTTRKLIGGIWNTLCLPFDVSMADLELALGENQDIQVRTFDRYGSDTKVMTFVNPFGGETAIPAGTPFLIKLNSDAVNPTFHAVTISNIAAQSIGEKGSVQFVGTYSPVELAIDGTNIFITKDNSLALPAAGKNTMNGLRAYIVVPENFDSSSTRLLMDDGETTAISDLAPSVVPTPKAIYNLNGQRVENVRRGLYVVNGKLTFVK